MKILVVTTSFPTVDDHVQLGGSFVLTECLAYEKAGARVIVITPGVPGIPDKEIFGRNIEVHRFSYFFPRRYQGVKTPGNALYHSMGVKFYLQFPLFLLFFSYAILVNGRTVDIVHCNWTLSALVTLPLRLFYKIPVVLTIRGSDIRTIPKFINKFIINNIDGVIDCFGPYPEMMALKNQFNANYITLPAIVKEPVGVNGDGDCEENDRVFTIVYIGRFDQTKKELGFGFFTLLEAIHLFAKDIPIKCIFVGDGSLMDELVRMAIKLGIQERVEFVGFREDIYSFIEIADLVVGGVALNGVSEEATLKRKPQLMPDIEMWQRNLWVDKENCLLYKTGDPASMAGSIRFALANPEKMKCIVEQVKLISAKYLATGQKGGDAYLKEFSKLIRSLKE